MKLKIFYTLILILCLPFFNACKPTLEPYHFQKVIGITYSGDSVLIDVNSLRPRVYNNTYHYNNNTLPYYQIPYYPQVIIRPNTRPIIRPNVRPNPRPVQIPTIPSKPRPTVITPNGKVPSIGSATVSIKNKKK